MPIKSGEIGNLLAHWERCALTPLLTGWPYRTKGKYDLRILYATESHGQKTLTVLGPTGFDDDDGHYNKPLLAKEIEGIGQAIERATRNLNLVGIGFRITIAEKEVDLIFRI